MRVTNQMMINTFRRNLSSSMREMDRLQEQLSSGRQINRPSDDPVGLTYALRLRTNLTENDQYQRNVSDGLTWLENTDSALNEAGQALQRARELAVYGANGTHSQESLDAIAREVAQIRQHLEAVANTEVAGRYLFAGTKTTTKPYDNGTWQGNTAVMKYEIGPGVTVPVNVSGAEVFGDNTDSVFKALSDLESKLLAGDTAGVSAQIGVIDQWLNKNQSIRAEVGARTNRFQLAQSRLEDGYINFSTLLTKTEDIDTAKVITELKMQEEVYRSALAAGARIIQPTLVDFLR
ncbi:MULTISPECIES: flagellar hook-associated protein FlgL [Carboxydocella]|uniref:Flagellar hook-associated protein 3 FlgL n=2 Tax=Carboxydocella TaxID=178898 RepID=A0A1T4RDR1_9FIRM|nr:MULTISPECIES: flagellar hook-associated protein FlgL [Carboxydocella]AVX21691.1 flagellar hook-associated protein 3 FlgL [Carboxydocella thermautotrophica]AVX32102.1 flagellar hook-associated protein 3 FlgL [Carboxydocella thermautotrophica]SKA14164.1 flagellar hook-associated protein 3 FlgL [Carboxydocella sporoproducens DSM 16521]GAW27662.1 flagellar hook-associated protein FlgL [Carboxydocella sp. ULO1]GAW31857.1 flagellar hook-associated protein FlgL [Carboxydocella sp. JDF658]